MPKLSVILQEELVPSPGEEQLTEADIARVVRHLANHRKVCE